MSCAGCRLPKLERLRGCNRGGTDRELGILFGRPESYRVFRGEDTSSPPGLCVLHPGCPGFLG